MAISCVLKGVVFLTAFLWPGPATWVDRASACRISEQSSSDGGDSLSRLSPSSAGLSAVTQKYFEDGSAARMTREATAEMPMMAPRFMFQLDAKPLTLVPGGC